MKKFKKILIWLLLIFLVLAVIFIFIIPNILNHYWGNDISPINDSDMKLVAVSVPMADNSFYDLEKIESNLDLKNVPAGKILAVDYLTSTEWDDQQVENLLNDNKLALELFSTAAEKKLFQSPATADPNIYSEEVPHMNSWRSASRLSGIKAIRLAKNGQGKEALAEAMKSIAIGDAIEKSQTDLLTYLVGVSFKESGIEVLQKIVTSGEFTPQELSEYKDKVLSYNLNNKTSLFKFEYLKMKNNIILLFAENIDKNWEVSTQKKFFIKNSYYFKINSTIKEYYNFYSQLNSNFEHPCISGKTAGTAFNSSDTQFNVFKAYFTENAVGKMLLTMPVLPLQQVLLRKCEIQEKFNKLLLEF